jgi:cell division protein ZapA
MNQTTEHQSESRQLGVEIAGQSYKFAVAPEHEAALLEAAALVDDRMVKIKSGSTSRGIERVAVMAAISFASDLLKLQDKQNQDSALPVEAIQHKLRELQARADEALRQYGLE